MLGPSEGRSWIADEGRRSKGGRCPIIGQEGEKRAKIGSV